MRQHLLLPLAILSIVITSCSKSLEDRIVGNWKIDDAYKKVFLGRDHFETGYENGVFTFYENGDATYTSSTDTLTGYYRTGRYSNDYYNSGSGQWETRGMKYLRLNLKNYPRNQSLEWEFDDFSFKNGWQMIKAEQYSLSNERVYEFVRQ